MAITCSLSFPLCLNRPLTAISGPYTHCVFNGLFVAFNGVPETARKITTFVLYVQILCDFV